MQSIVSAEREDAGYYYSLPLFNFSSTFVAGLCVIFRAVAALITGEGWKSRYLLPNLKLVN